MTVASAFYEHCRAPQNVGPMDAPSAEGVAGRPPTKPFMRIQLRLRTDRIEQAAFVSTCCSAARATGSFLTCRLNGMTLAEAGQITPQNLRQALTGLPRERGFYVNLAVDALRMAISEARRGTRA